MRISIGADERLAVVDRTLAYLDEKGFAAEWFGPAAGATIPWPEVGKNVAEAVVKQQADQGILFCWTGTGVSIATNKVPGIRAALCFDAETARGARLWNDANVVCLSLRLTTEITVVEILDAWFSTEYFPNPTDDACLAVLEQLDQTYRQQE